MVPRVSFVVVNWREPEATAACVESIKAQKTDAELEIILVDNQSTPESCSRLESITDVKVVAHAENLGYTGGMNSGFAVAKGDFVAALNNDLVLAPDWVERGLVEMAGESVAIVGGAEYLWDDTHPAWDTSNPVHAMMRIDRVAGYTYRVDEGMETQDVSGLDGNNMLLSREALDRLGGFDNDFYMYYEDADICARALALGYRIRYCADMAVWHRRNLSSDKIVYRRQFLAQRNHLVFVARHFPTDSWRSTVRHLALQYLVFATLGHEAGLRGVRRTPPIAWVRRRAHLASGLWGLTHFRHMEQKRRQLEDDRQRSDGFVDRLPVG